jgi:exosome complex RNA-binding protein Rrp42 (RNase PH superfamily)
LYVYCYCALLFYFPPGAGIDRTSLVVVEGKICWDLYIDGLVISSDGNLLDALGAAIKVKLKIYLYL